MTVSLIRTVLLYILLIVAVRLMGKRQVAEMEPAEPASYPCAGSFAGGPPS